MSSDTAGSQDSSFGSQSSPVGQAIDRDLFDEVFMSDVKNIQANDVRFGSVQKSLVYLGEKYGWKNLIDFTVSVNAVSPANIYIRQDADYTVELKLHGRKTPQRTIPPETVSLKELTWYCLRKEEKKRSGIITFRVELCSDLDPLLKYLYHDCDSDNIYYRKAIREMYSPERMYADIEFKLVTKTIHEDTAGGDKKKKKKASDDDDTTPLFDKGKFGGRDNHE